MRDGPPDAGDGRRDHVAAVGDRRGAEHDDELGAKAEQVLDGSGQRGLLMRHAALGDDGRARRRQTLSGDPQRLVDDLRSQPGQDGRHDADALDDIGRDPQRTLSGRRHGGIAQAALDAEWNELDGADHLAFDHRLERRQGREGDRLIDLVDAIDGGAVDDQHAGLRRKQIGAPGEGAIDMNALARHHLGDVSGGLVL